MNKLSFKFKIIASISILFILLIFPSRTIFLNHFQEREVQKLQLIGLEYIQIMHKIIDSIQIHRELSNAYVQGNQSSQDLAEELREQEEILYLKKTSIFEYDAGTLNMLSKNQNFAKAVSQFELSKVDNIPQNISSKEIFEKHNSIIKLLHDSILDISKETAFNRSKDLRINYLADMLQDKLLHIYEYTGRLKGLSSGILTQKSMIQEQKKTLYSLSSNLASLESDLVDNKILTKLSNYQALQQLTTSVSDKLKRILVVIDEDIILKHEFTHNIQSFSQKATSAMYAQEELYDKFLFTYKHTIQELNSNLEKELWYLLAGFITIILLSSYIFVAFYQSITGNLKKLQTASEMISEGQTEIHLDVDKDDEIGDALLAFNTMSDRLSKNISFLDGYKMAIDKSSIVSKTDLKGIITYANKMFCDVSGYTQEELIGSSHNIVRHPDVPKGAFKDMWDTIQSKKIWKGIVKNRKKDGSHYIVNATIIPILDNRNEIIEYVAVRHDITELEENKEEIKKQRIDLLTGLPNRNQLVEDLKNVIKPIIFYINIDDFSGFNDFYGERAGDNVLLHITKILSDMKEDKKFQLYKLESDQFILLFEEGYLSRDNLQYFFEDIIQTLEEKVVSSEYENHSRIAISVSSGAATYYANDDYQKLILYSNIARKKAQSEHKKFLLFQHSMRKHEDYAHNLEWVKRIKEAIDEDRIVCYYQPIFADKNTKALKYETLVRLLDKDGQAISPFFFLEIARKAKLYPQITQIIIDKSFEKFKEKPQIEFSVNLTIDDILSEKTTNYIYQKLETY
ncbi:MAG: diguanylate cyclase, partial [Epsilonproteobacteria bacterium]|nr:diguanylate cyclase [Campylobacterota bacterium]